MATGTLELTGVGHTYGSRGGRSTDRVVALAAVNLAFPAGKITGVLGPNGSGKSTLLRVVAGLVEPGAGIRRWQPSESVSQASFGFMPESRGLRETLTLRESLTWQMRLQGRRAAAAAERVNHWVGRLELEAIADRRASALSKGHQRLAALVQALVGDPTWLVLDEPLDGLDPLRVDQVQAILAELRAGGTTVVLTSHLWMGVESICDQVVLMDAGRVLVAGSPAEVLAATKATSLHEAFSNQRQLLMRSEPEEAS